MMTGMIRRRLGRAALCVVALGVWGCSSSSGMKRPMAMEGVVELLPPKTKQVVSYRCSVDLQTRPAFAT
jgi:hypothetical protein